ncbi:MAG: 16S rRNA (cytidine(1402)-2'-O)-methyltransferase [Syntrophobacteraceae bacterium]
MPSNHDDCNEPGNGQLFLVATPIGNLGDITLRALETLRNVDIIAAEDTRRTRKLLSYFDIHKPLVSYHEHNARASGNELLEKIASGRNIALVTDAGTPCVSDPGKLLVQAALERGIEPVVIPGPTALICALVVSGLASQPFAFLGFAPVKGVERRRFFQANAGLQMTLILYESPKRLVKTLKDISQNWGDRKAAVARELTKMHEEIFRGRISEALLHFAGEVRGEIVLVVEGASHELAGSQSSPAPENAELADAKSAPGVRAWKEELAALLAAGLSSKEAVQAIAHGFDLPRRLIYQAALEMKKKHPTS